jgi:hypothetical protein
VVPDICDESGRIVFEVAGKLCFGRVPEVEGVGDECCELKEDEPLELVVLELVPVVLLEQEESGLLKE